MSARRSGLTLILALFLACVAGSWAWFHVGATADRESLQLSVRHSIDGWRFDPEPVGRQAQETLATTNLFNGTFLASNGDRVIVFAAEWDGTDPRQRTALPHTPDICWVGAGWVPVEAGQPHQVPMRVDGGELPFQCRIFQAPNGQKQCVVWCSILGGKPVEDVERWIPSGTTPQERAAQNLDRQRLTGLSHFVRAVRDRDGAARYKQFVRFSVPMTGDWKPALERLKAFAPLWLRMLNEPTPRTA